MHDLPWDKIVEAGVVVAGAGVSAFRGAIKGHARQELRMREVEKGLEAVQGHLIRQDRHLERQDSSAEETLKLMKEHKTLFDTHVKDDDKNFKDVKTGIRAIGRRVPIKPRTAKETT